MISRSDMRRLSLALVGVVASLSISTTHAQQSARSSVSFVDRTLNDAQKYMLMVDGKPFFMTNVQIRLDKLRYHYGWDANAREAIVAQAAKDGFNTISVPIQWVEVEPVKDQFDWHILDEYLELAKKYGLKVELLWFGQNSFGDVQWLGDSKVNPIRLRTPDYVLSSPAPGSPGTTSEFVVRRDISNYTLDLNDPALLRRETYVLSRVMGHIAEWDRANGSGQVVIGVQVGNEVRGIEKKMFGSSDVIAHINALASAVKQSNYVVWTRVNSVYADLPGNFEAFQNLRRNTGSNIDFIGSDYYTWDVAGERSFLDSIPSVVPHGAGNFRMLTEIEADKGFGAMLRLAALSGNTALDFYDMIGPDSNGLYNRDGANGFRPLPHVPKIRVVNRLLNSAMTDVARHAQGYGLYVHNWRANSKKPTLGVDGLSFVPAAVTNQAVSLSHSATETLLMTVEEGHFDFPPTLGVTEASKGRFDGEGKWVSEGEIPFTAVSIKPPAGSLVRLVHANTGFSLKSRRQAEFSALGGGAKVEDEGTGFAGEGYVKLDRVGASTEWDIVEPEPARLFVRYANRNAYGAEFQLSVNGNSRLIHLAPTGATDRFEIVALPVLAGVGRNLVRLEARDSFAVTIDELGVGP